MATQQATKVPLSKSPCPLKIPRMTGSTLSIVSKRQKHRKLSNKKLSDAIWEYWVEKFEKGKHLTRKLHTSFGSIASPWLTLSKANTRWWACSMPWNKSRVWPKRMSLWMPSFLCLVKGFPTRTTTSVRKKMQSCRATVVVSTRKQGYVG